ncbi:hypothetical protein E2C01_086892 [Portunus trituberculatus]|uniref:Uncharacterized protein n=1 Tax=Portunus trituberculatus TaxID=210409 RepID=A0A5B7JBU2_PORTR|nr:hypothetical protein [Portunus trituberculatus]
MEPHEGAAAPFPSRDALDACCGSVVDGGTGRCCAGGPPHPLIKAAAGRGRRGCGGDGAAAVLPWVPSNIREGTCPCIHPQLGQSGPALGGRLALIGCRAVLRRTLRQR